ncbi:uncharacterized protein LOC132603682 isoform X2 [Lycium barbarum]|uniref:uncharacterized protein LOC132603682 isoform X2 n=1 Tax=Lycium barbarum TaxID=112863 RepID=UPI00293E8BC6|nr:uncharacterized protein LOC132603682 isoform X2 [Lycium barbarum]
MSSERQAVSVGELVEEAKKRVVLLIICAIGLSYLMSLTSSSVFVNLPAAALLIVSLRYLSLDFDARMKAVTYKGKSSVLNSKFQRKHIDAPKTVNEKSTWRKKVNSPAVEEAIDHFTRHMVSEWVTDLWYSRITSDTQGPEELVQIMNGVLGEISRRMRTINLIDLITRDIINLIRTHLELFRASKMRIQKKWPRSLTIEELDVELKLVLAADDKLHPALFSAEAEHKVLQHLMDGLISYTFQTEDVQCSLFRNIVRELLACVVVRPVLNLANPRFINERIESLVVSAKKGDEDITAVETEPQSRTVGSGKISADHFSRVLDPSAKGVELVQLKNDQPNDTKEHAMHNRSGTDLLKDPLLSFDTRSTLSWSSLPSQTDADDGRGIQRNHYGGEWGEMLDLISRRKTEALAPENLDNIWTKGRNYKRKEEANRASDRLKKSSLVSAPKSLGHSKEAQQKESERQNRVGAKHYVKDNTPTPGDLNRPSYLADYSYQEENEHKSDEVESESSNSYTTEDEESSSVTGLDSPGTQVWGGKNIRNVNHIHHPLENNEGHKRSKGKASKAHVRSKHLNRVLSGRKRSRLSNQTEDVWQEIQRTSFLLGDGQDILNSKENVKPDGLSDDSETEIFSNISNDMTASSSVLSRRFLGNQNMGPYSAKGSIIADSFLKLRSEVLNANIVRCGSKTFAVYSISVTDMNNNSWSIKRRFRHFEELHWRLKVFPEYNLHLPPKHYLSSSLDVPVIRERCRSLDTYLEKLLLLPTVSNSIEVWDFLSVDSQTYSFSNSLSIIETLLVDLDGTVRHTSKEPPRSISPQTDPTSRMEQVHAEHESRFRKDYVALSPPKRPLKETFEDSTSGNKVHTNRKSTPNMQTTSNSVETNSHASPESLVAAPIDPTFPSELQDGGWIRRKAFWVAKQVLQLGMGDAFDDWVIEKIQRLRRGSVVAAGIQRVEQILWPEGIFITKRPARQRPAPSPSPNSPQGQPPTPLSSPRLEDSQKLDDMQQQEAERRAKLVYELMIDKAPAAVVGLVGHKEYEQCAKDLYYFIQSSVFMKQLVLDLLELLLLSAFPELTSVFNALREEKGKFGKLKID